MFNNTYKMLMQHYVYSMLLASTIIFFTAYENMTSRNFLLVLNGIYIGQMVAIAATFGPYFFHVLFTHDPYTRARQYAITTGLQHLSYFLVVTYSVTARRYGGAPTVPVDIQLLLSRYVILMAGFLQLMAPDFGKPIMYGLNRKALWFGSSLGFVVALGVIWLQFWPSITVPFGLDDLLNLGD